MILLVGNQADPHVQAVLSSLHSTNSPVVLLDIYATASAGIVHRISDGVCISLGETKFDLSVVKSVWWRQKAKFQISSDSVTELYDSYFVQREWNTLFDYIANKTSRSFSINNRSKAKLAENKLFQLEVAERLDLRAPATIVTNRSEDAKEYFEACGVRRCIYKTFSPYSPPSAKIAYTTELDLSELLKDEHRDTTDATPGIFQQLIEAQYELRVTVVGNQVFTVGIDVPADSSGVDWRQSLFTNKYRTATLDSEVQRRLLNYHQELGLFFAAYDFIVDKRGDVFFLEANPGGQWMWLEQQLGLPISIAIAQALRDQQ